MVRGILVGNVQHLLQSRSGGAEKQEVIRISMDSSIIIAQLATAPRALEKGEEFVHIEAEHYWGSYGSLANTISDGKLTRDPRLPYEELNLKWMLYYVP